MLFSHSFYRSMNRPGGSRRLALVASMVGMLTGLSLLGAQSQAQAQSNAGHAGHANHWPTKPVRLLHIGVLRRGRTTARFAWHRPQVFRCASRLLNSESSA